MNDNAKTIALGVLLFSVILMGRTADHTNAEPAEALSNNIAMSSVARVVAPEPVPSQIPEIPVVTQQAAPSRAPLNPERHTPNAPIDEAISAVAGAVVDLDSGKTFWERRTFQRHPLASLTKLMTAVVAAEHIGYDKIVTIADADVLSEGDAGGFKSGEAFTVRDLVSAMLLASANDAADALARFYGTKPFVDAMQRKAAELGMTDTSFFDPSGLSSLNQSTAGDLVAFIRAIKAAHPDILVLSNAKERAILEQTSGHPRVIKSINAFAGEPEFLGGKTGYTPEAHGNLISLFNANDRTMLIIVLGTDDRFGETKLLYEWAKTRQ